MIDAPLATDLGVLTTTRVLFYYEGPRLFVARSQAGQDYLVICAEDNEENESETYMYIALSPDRLRLVLSGREELRALVESPPDERVFVDVVRWMDYEPEHIGKWYGPSDLDPRWLPTSGATINVEVADTRQFSSDVFTRSAVEAHQDRQAFRIEHQEHRRNQFELGKLARIYESLQDFVYAQVADLMFDRDWGPKIPSAVRDDASLQVLGFSEGSIVVETSLPAESLLSRKHPLLAETAGGLARLLDGSSPLLRPDIDAQDIGMSVRTVARLITLLKSLVLDEARLLTYTATAQGQTTVGRLSTSDAKSMLHAVQRTDKVIEDVEFYPARLEGLNFSKNRFALSTEDNDPIEGKLGRDVVEVARGFRVGGSEVYRIGCRKTSAISGSNDTPTVTYEMQSIEIG